MQKEKKKKERKIKALLRKQVAGLFGPWAIICAFLTDAYTKGYEARGAWEVGQGRVPIRTVMLKNWRTLFLELFFFFFVFSDRVSLWLWSLSWN